MENTVSMRGAAARMKLASPLVASAPEAVRNNALLFAAEALEAEKEEIFRANADDLARAESAGIGQAVMKRLLFDEKKLAAVTEGLRQLAELPDPIGRLTLDRQLDEGLELRRVTCPIGVIGVIFEARPDALVQISSLCLKSGNCAVLKGGSETSATNSVLFRLMHAAAVKAGMPEECLYQAELRSEIGELLKCDEYVDLLIPRGSNAFVRYIMDNTRIPVMGHSDGVCHVYADKSADPEKAARIIVDAKTQYPAACNAAETLLVDRNAPDNLLTSLCGALRGAGVTVRGTDEVRAVVPYALPLTEKGFSAEYLDKEISVGLVDGVKEAVGHINRYGSHHTDAIIAEDNAAAGYFTAMVDSSGVYVNASTRFADGFRYGFGAEVGISTSKLHARGPVGLDGLMTYKYVITGSGSVVSDYASGAKEFHFRDR